MNSKYVIPHQIPVLRYKISIECSVYQMQALFWAMHEDLKEIIADTTAIDRDTFEKVEVMSRLENLSFSRLSTTIQAGRKKAKVNFLAKDAIFLHGYLQDYADFDLWELLGTLDQRLKSLDHIFKLPGKVRVFDRAAQINENFST